MCFQMKKSVSSYTFRDFSTFLCAASVLGPSFVVWVYQVSKPLTEEERAGCFVCILAVSVTCLT